MRLLERLGIGIISSLIASLIAFVLISLFSETVRRALTAVASTFLGIDVKYVFKNGRESQNSVQLSLKRSKTIKIFAGRGNEFQGSFYLPLLEANEKVKKDIKILLPDIYNQPRSMDWIAYREDELSKVDHAFGKGILKTQIAATFGFLHKYLESKILDLRCYNYPHIGRIIITDDSVFFTPYSAVLHGRDSQVYQYVRGEMYDYYIRFFDMIWADSKPF